MAVTVFENLADNPIYRLPPWGLIARHTSRHADGFICFTEGARQHAIERGCPPPR